MGIIHKLDEVTINKIAAGEVIARPSSIVKELVENSIDAGATSIVIEIKNGGKTYIKISDNGSGINTEDIPLVFERHATSKINSLEDVYATYTMGFRGEAMSSIASVADVTLITKSIDEDEGSHVHMRGGKVIESKKIGTNNGTTIEVKDVFFNVPARQKFLKTDLSEQNAVVDIIEKIALFNSIISFKLIVNDKQLFQTPGNGDMLTAIHTIMGKNKAKSMLEVDYFNDRIQIKGYVSEVELTRGNAAEIIFAINSRVINNRTLVEAVKQAYRTMLMNNRYPISILNISILPSQIDVNVHPAKEQVRFDDEHTVFSAIYKAVKKAIQGDDISDLEDDTVHDTAFVAPVGAVGQATTATDNTRLEVKEEYIYSKPQTEVRPCASYTPIQEKPKSHIVREENKQYDIPETREEINIIGQLFNTYILCNDRENYYMIDQHAAHERQIYEDMKKALDTKTVLAQNMLMPIMLEIDRKQMATVMDNIQIIRDLGFNIDQFGDSTIKISSVPIILGQPCNGTVINDIIENIVEAKNNLEVMKEKMLISLSCKNAIKANDNMKKEEMKEIAEKLLSGKIPEVCPHGRPIIIITTKTELEKKFKRIV